MKFKKGQKILKVPPMGSLEAASLEDGSLRGHPVEVVHIDDLLKNRKRYPDQSAYPMQVALALGANEVHLWPTPHKAGEVKLQYYPPMETI